MLKTMTLTDTDAQISKFEVMCAFFRTEEEENVEMARELNKMLNAFYRIERRKRQNVNSLSFDIQRYKKAIEYIRDALLEL